MVIIESLNDKFVRLFGKDSKNPAREITFQVTENCNLQCTYCYQNAKSNNRMTFDIAKTLIDKWLIDDPSIASLYSSLNSSGVILEFIGGEPLLEIELIDQITDYFISRCIELKHPWATRYFLNICTNGELYFNPKVQEYIGKNRRHLSLNITVDGNKQLHDTCRLHADGSGSYDNAVAAIKHWRDHWHGYMGSKLTLSPDNVQYCSQALIDMLEFGYDNIYFNPAFEKGWELKHAQIYYQELKKFADYVIEHNILDTHTFTPLDPRFGHPMLETDNNNWCGGVGSHMLALDYKGDLFPCLRYMGSSLSGKQEPYIIGNIHDGLIETNRINCLNCIDRRSQSTDECYYCPIASGCSWCSAYNYEEFGTPNKRATYICDMHKAKSLAMCYLWNKYYIKNNIPLVYNLDCPEEWALQIIDKQEYDYLKTLTERGS